MAAQNNPDKPAWMADIDKKADTRARRLMNARGKDPADHPDELNSEIDRIKNDLLEVHYSNNPQDKGSYQPNTVPVSAQNVPQASEEETLQKVETQARRAQTVLQSLDDKIPEGIPIVSSAVRYKKREEDALRTIVTGTDPETGESLDAKERIKRAAKYEAESIQSALTSATEIATLGGSTSIPEALGTLRDVAGQRGVDVLIDNAPATLRKLAASVDNFGVAEAIRNSAQTLEILAKDPSARAVMVEIIQGSRSITDLRSIVTNDARLQETLKSFEAQINSIPRFKENTPPDIPPPPVVPPGSFNPLRSPSMGMLAIQVRPQRIETNRTEAARERTREYREGINQAGMLQFTNADLRRLKALYPDLEFTNEDLTAAIHLGLMGVNPKRLAEKARRAEVTKVIDETEQVYLTRISRILKVYNEANPELAQDLEEVNGVPQVTILRMPAPSTPIASQPSETGTMIFRQIGDRALQPLLKKGNKEITKKVSGEVAKKFAKTATKQVVSKTASTAGAEIGATAGSVIPIVGNIIGAIVGWLVGTLVAGAIEALAKRAKDFKDLAGGIIIGGGQAIGWVLGILWAATVSIGQATIIAIISIPLFVIFAMYVINTSAWVIPPWGGNGGIPNETDSAFIDVTKTPEPSTAASAPTSITYVITITAEQSALSNVSYAYDCTAILESGNIACPSDPNVVEIAETTCGTTIPATGSCTFSYTVEYGAQYDDSLVTDTITVTADAEGLTGEVSTATANVIIGDPPTGCMYAAGDNWPADKEAVLNQAIVTLRSTSPTYSALVCAGGNIPICWGPTAGAWGYHFHDADCDITMDSQGDGLANSNNALYILTHELGHHLSAISGGYFLQYLDSGAPSELPLCSYSGTGLPGEDGQQEGFAEAFALYITPYWPTKCGGGSFQSFYPLHYGFVDDVL